MKSSWHLILWICQVALLSEPTSSFSIILMGRAKGKLQRTVNGSTEGSAGKKAQAQELTGVSLPEENKIKGWEFGNNQRLACANISGRFYAIQGNCPRCAFDLYRGKIVTDEAFGPDLPRIACPTCSITYSLKTGKHGPPFKRGGLSEFVGGLALSATALEANKDCKAYTIATDDEGRIFCRERI